MIVDAMWDEVSEGSFVQDRSLVLWRVEDVQGDWYLLRDREGRQVPVQHAVTDPVKVYAPSRMEALMMLEQHLGPFTILDDDGQPAVVTPRDPVDRAMTFMELSAAQPALAARTGVRPIRTTGKNALDGIKKHLLMMHGVYGNDIKTIKGAVEAHDTLHADPIHRMAHPHHHREGAASWTRTSTSTSSSTTAPTSTAASTPDWPPAFAQPSTRPS